MQRRFGDSLNQESDTLLDWVREGASPLKEETLQMRARDLHGQIITPTHRPEEKGGFSSGLRNSLIPPDCSWGSLLKYAFGSSPFFIERRGAGGVGRCIELLKHAETMGGGGGKR